jgi:hypothetical protein
MNMAKSVKKVTAKAGDTKTSNTKTSDTKKVSAKTNDTLRGPSDNENRTVLPTHERIAAHAYDLWELGGRQNGTAESDWLRAEEELIGPSK